MPQRKKFEKLQPKQCSNTSHAASSKGAISMLQEYVQGSHTFHMPSNYSVLQWTFDSQMADAATLEFRATVAFLLEGVPHHIAGSWQPKKRDAQRDAAERALNLFVGRWGEQLLQRSQDNLKQQFGSNLECCRSNIELLEEFCQESSMCRDEALCWSISWEANTCRATVGITVLNVAHQFAGSLCNSEAEACADVAGKVLWYLQCPNFSSAYEPDPAAAAIVTRKIAPPPPHWAHDSVSEGALEVAERKTAIMRVQNRLQQVFSQQLKPGMSVWAWSYEVDPNDEEWPTLCRATVNVPVIGETFTGDWVRGQRDAQLDTIQWVTSFLDTFGQS
jgi:hypothetical protein